MTDPTLEEIARRAEAATEGPWAAGHYSSIVGVPITAQPDKTKNTLIIGGTQQTSAESGDYAAHRAESEANAKFIAHARIDIPYLLSRLREAEAEIARLREALRPFANEGADTDYDDDTADSEGLWIGTRPKCVGKAAFTIGDLRRARAALDEEGQQ